MLVYVVRMEPMIKNHINFLAPKMLYNCHETQENKKNSQHSSQSPGLNIERRRGEEG